MPTRSLVRTLLVLLTVAPLCGAADNCCRGESLPLVFTDDFEHDVARWETTDPNPDRPFWTLTHADSQFGNATQVLRVLGTSNYRPPHRSPHSIALVKDVVVKDFEMKVRLQSTNVDAGPHRDLCLFWGYQDPAHFYYVHLGAKADPHACQIFIVNGADRIAITDKTVETTPWKLGWHTVKVVRRVDDGAMEVFFDNMQQPHMTAVDKTMAWGRVGLGTFDDNGNFDDFQLRAELVAPPGQEQ